MNRRFPVIWKVARTWALPRQGWPGLLVASWAERICTEGSVTPSSWKVLLVLVEKTYPSWTPPPGASVAGGLRRG